jgi:hypothetical protein
VFAEEVAGPLGLDMWIGLPDAEQPASRRTCPRRALSAEGWRTMCQAMGVDPELRLMRAIGETFQATED